MSVECLCLQMPAKALINLHTAQDLVEFNAYIYIYIGVAQGPHVAIVLGVCGLERTTEHIYISISGHMTCGVFYI